MIIAIDFDGTLVEHKFPEIGVEVPYAFDYLKRFQEAGAKLILYTMRSNNQGINSITENGGTRDFLTEAVKFCTNRGIEFWGINNNPEQYLWSTSPKVYAHLYIDDAAYGCPLMNNTKDSIGRPYVDWRDMGEDILYLINKENKK